MENEKRINICIDGVSVDICVGETLADAAKKLGFNSETLTMRPLAAQIGGRVYSLDYVPGRYCDVKLLRYGNVQGSCVYERTMKLVMICAIRHELPNVRVVEKYSLPKGVCFGVTKPDNSPLTQTDVDAITARCQDIIDKDLPIKYTRWDIDDAIKYYEAEGQDDKSELLKWRNFDYFSVYSIQGYDVCDYYYGQMLTSTGCLSGFAITMTGDNDFVLTIPSQSNPQQVEVYTVSPKMSSTMRESEEWANMLHCTTAAELNSLVKNGGIRELIRINEALHERTYAKIADSIAKKSSRAILIAGPSSSGKTTSANRLATQLKTLGLSPIMLSLDNYYLDRDAIEKDDNGDIDYEHIKTIDVKLFSHNLAQLMRGETIEAPTFDFLLGKRGKSITICGGKEKPIIIEGIHALNPMLLTDEIAMDEVYRIYVSALTTLNLDDHNRIRTTQVRLLRRLVRDYATRSASMDRTLSMWPSVRRGEEKWIFPYQEKADSIFNTTLVYELCVLKKYAYKLLCEVTPESPNYATAHELVKFLNYFVDADVDIEKEIPPTSIIREFIGGNTFYE